MKNSPLIRMSFSIEEELYAGLESLLREHGYGNRSEFIRDMIRKQLARRQCAASGEVIGTVSVLCDLGRAGIEAKVNSILDRGAVKILGASRFAVGGNCSTTMITALGTGAAIRGVADSIRKVKGVIQVEFVITTPAACGETR